MKRQDTVLSSSSRRETVPENNRTKSIGCMSGIFHLVCKYQHRRKFLTFGRKQEKNVVSSPTKPNPLRGLTQPSPSGGNKKGGDTCRHFRRLSCDVPRSPTLQAEIRRSNSVNSPQNSQTPPALVARLMGLDGIPAASAESAAEKRRKLLGALEKCDEDLKALKKIIETVRSAENLRSPPVGKEEFMKRVKRCSEFNSEQPSPVSVLDEFIHSPLGSSTKRHTIGRVVQQQMQQQRKKKPGEEDIINLCIFNRISTQQSFQTKNENRAASPLWSSRAMVESVDEACRDIAWGEKRELGRIGLALQDHICRDLIEEFVIEMGRFNCLRSLPFEACKRRLCF
ncbi:hypothetical protein L1049_009261 [Liquidambar formosana]|uniref:DUF3741 domain-containing protein n=1 Tax=Liquidambar formosana TaxID=63359 RepID=A0AAP0S8P8_LIQFO